MQARSLSKLISAQPARLLAQCLYDPYMCFADFDSYVAVYGRMIDAFRKSGEWMKKSLYNIAGAGFFSSDRSIREYAENIWHISPVR